MFSIERREDGACRTSFSPLKYQNVIDVTMKAMDPLLVR
jgi:hypothetical protein